MDEVLPKYMNIQTFCRHVGLTRFQFLRVRDRHNIPTFEHGQHKMLEVEVAIRALAREPGIDAILSEQGNELVRELRETLQAE